MLHLHSIFRYLIILVALWAIISAFTGAANNRQFLKKDKTPGLIYMIFMDIQLLIGLFLYFVGPYGYKRFQDMAVADIMGNSATRFFVIEHLFGMIIAIILVHIGYAISKKDLSPKKKFKKIGWYYLIAFIILLVSIPWPFWNVGRGLYPGV